MNFLLETKAIQRRPPLGDGRGLLAPFLFKEFYFEKVPITKCFYFYVSIKVARQWHLQWHSGQPACGVLAESAVLKPRRHGVELVAEASVESLL